MLNEVLNGLLTRSDWRRGCLLPIGTIPCGTGNGTNCIALPFPLPYCFVSLLTVGDIAQASPRRWVLTIPLLVPSISSKAAPAVSMLWRLYLSLSLSLVRVCGFITLVADYTGATRENPLLMSESQLGHHSGRRPELREVRPPSFPPTAPPSQIKCVRICGIGRTAPKQSSACGGWAARGCGCGRSSTSSARPRGPVGSAICPLMRSKTQTQRSRCETGASLWF
jgi:hypothetical protein